MAPRARAWPSARAAALEPAARARNWLDFRYLAPAGAMAAAVLATVLVARPWQAGRTVNEGTGAALYDMELLADADALDIAQETDLDFIEWAAAQGEQGTGRLKHAHCLRRRCARRRRCRCGARRGTEAGAARAGRAEKVGTGGRGVPGVPRFAGHGRGRVARVPGERPIKGRRASRRRRNRRPRSRTRNR